MNVLIIDGMNLFIRCFVVVPTMDANGNSIGGLTGFLKSLKNMISESKPDRVIVAWDGEGGSRRRRGIFAEYKEGRKVRLNRQDDLENQDESFKNMGGQMTKLKTLLGLLGVLQVEAPECEADDVIALICKFIFPDDKKVVLTSDRDMLQLVDDNTIVYSPTKKIYWTKQTVVEKIGVLAENYIFVKALMGDGSDNVKGMGGIGEKTAVKLFPFLAERPVTVEEIRLHCEANRETGSKYRVVLDQWDHFLENMKLMQLSSPIISPQAARTIRISSTEQRPRFVFTEFKLQLIRDGIQVIDPDLIGVFKSYQFRAEATS
jgi:5'-3' exonuclease